METPIEPTRNVILKRIKSCLDAENQWAKSRSYEIALKYNAKAEALIELLEIHDCGSTGGFDRDDPNCRRHSELKTRYEWLVEKYKKVK